MTDIGTGSYTILAQTAAEMLGVPLEQVAVHPAIPVSRFLRVLVDNGARIPPPPAFTPPV